MDNESKRRLRHMLQEEDNNIDLTIYGLGNVRTHRDYELYAGIDFKHRKLHPDTLKGVEPPINDNSDWYLIAESNYTYTLNLPQISTNNLSFIYIGIEDTAGNVLHRVDLTEYQPQITVNFTSYYQPYKWVFWPVDKSNNWLQRHDFAL